jgi:hypothetical protein
MVGFHHHRKELLGFQNVRDCLIDKEGSSETLLRAVLRCTPQSLQRMPLRPRFIPSIIIILFDIT